LIFDPLIGEELETMEPGSEEYEEQLGGLGERVRLELSAADLHEREDESEDNHDDEDDEDDEEEEEEEEDDEDDEEEEDEDDEEEEEGGQQKKEGTAAEEVKRGAQNSANANEGPQSVVQSAPGAHHHVNPIAMEGSLTKQGSKVKTWRKRYFVFDPETRRLEYYKTHQKKTLKGSMVLDTVFCPKEKKQKHRLDFIGTVASHDNEVTICASAASEELKNQWLQAMTITSANSMLFTTNSSAKMVFSSDAVKSVGGQSSVSEEEVVAVEQPAALAVDMSALEAQHAEALQAKEAEHAAAMQAKEAEHAAAVDAALQAALQAKDAAVQEAGANAGAEQALAAMAVAAPIAAVEGASGAAPASVTSSTPTDGLMDPRADPKYAKFTMMVKQRMPEGAIRQRMSMVGLKEVSLTIFSCVFFVLPTSFSSKKEEIAAFFGDTGDGNADEASNRNEHSLDETRADPKYAKFTMMVKQRMPEGAIRQRMSMVGLKEVSLTIFSCVLFVLPTSFSSKKEEIAAFFGAGGKTGATLRRSAAPKKKANEPWDGLKPKEGASMKRLHWTSLKTEQIEQGGDSFWGTAYKNGARVEVGAAAGIAFTEDEAAQFTDLFSNKARAPKKEQPKAAAAPKKKRLQLLSNSRSMTAQIARKKVLFHCQPK
jgi:hypothetical protein